MLEFDSIDVLESCNFKRQVFVDFVRFVLEGVSRCPDLDETFSVFLINS